MRKKMNTINIYNILLYAGISACICGIAYYIWKKSHLPMPPTLKEEITEAYLQYDDVISYLKMLHLSSQRHIAFLGVPEDKTLSACIKIPIIPSGYSALIVAIFDSTNNTIDKDKSKIVISKGIDDKLTKLIGNNTIVKLL